MGDARAVVRGERQSVFEDTGGVSNSSILHHDVSSGQGATLPAHCPNPAQLHSTPVDSRAPAGRAIRSILSKISERWRERSRAA